MCSCTTLYRRSCSNNQHKNEILSHIRFFFCLMRTEQTTQKIYLSKNKLGEEIYDVVGYITKLRLLRDRYSCFVCVCSLDAEY
jgi:hypothetical protein